MATPRPFGVHGSEKMIYDVRMGPQCLHADGVFWAVYQANPAGGKALPHLVRRDPDGRWREPVALGDVAGWDHHFAPILWADADWHLHVLYHCHIHDGGRHLVSDAGYDLSHWGPAAAPARSVSYPRVIPRPDGSQVLYYRALGHMGFWTCRTSTDGGFTWQGPSVPHVDFDRDPEIPGDDWAGSYHSVALSRDGRSLHVAMVYWDERNLPHPRYGRRVGFMNRYHLYYLRLHPDSGEIATIDGTPLPRPLNRRRAAECMVFDSDDRLTNMPAILVDPDDRPCFLMPLSGDRLDDCDFWFFRREAGRWARYRVAPTSSTWNGSHLEFAADGSITAFLIGRATMPGERLYGGGPLQEWRSRDGGRTWQQVADLTPEPGLLCNNPKPVEGLSGEPLPRTITFFAWPGPADIQPANFTGRAYLWRNGEFL